MAVLSLIVVDHPTKYSIGAAAVPLVRLGDWASRCPTRLAQFFGGRLLARLGILCDVALTVWTRIRRGAARTAGAGFLIAYRVAVLRRLRSRLCLLRPRGRSGG